MRKEIEEINNTQDPQKKIEAYNRLTSELNNVTKQYKQLNLEQKNAEKIVSYRPTRICSAQILIHG